MYKITLLIIIVSGLLGAMERPPTPKSSWSRQGKRSSSEDEKPHFLIRNPRRKLVPDLLKDPKLPVTIPAPASLQAKEPVQNIKPHDNDEIIVEEIIKPFNCKYFGIRDCNQQFTDREAEWRHIYRFHGIIAAKYEEYNSIICELPLEDDDE